MLVFWADSFTTWMLQTMNVWFLRPQKGEQSGSKTTHTSVIRSNATAFNYPSNYRPQYIEVFLQVQLDKTNFIRSTWGIIHSKKTLSENKPMVHTQYSLVPIRRHGSINRHNSFIWPCTFLKIWIVTINWINTQFWSTSRVHLW